MYKSLFLAFNLLLTKASAQTLQIKNDTRIGHRSLYPYTVEVSTNTAYVVFDKPAILGKEEPNGWNVYKLDTKRKFNITASATARIEGMNGGRKIILLGSGKSGSHRKAIVRDLDDLTKGKEIISTRKFFKKVLRNSKGQFRKLNIQAATSAGKILVLANAPAYGAHKDNYIILTGVDFYKQQDLLGPNISDIRIRKFPLYEGTDALAITGFTYVPQKKLLLFTAIRKVSGLETESFIGWISDFDSKINDLQWKADKIFPLPDLAPAFAYKRIESIAFESINNNALTMRLLADDGKLGARLYTVVLNLP
ncbi:hypothetical protein Cpin_6358 [Sporocytophaga myxococcoides]|uniref:Uncharacterized protein n=1 Tax=Sporocytophaga myxococcoides TaxID=153721 RepID=A0A098LHC8_9BACT|nr:hypothetical protein [Sporocytophaga myxococcoides]GAL86345.1 hypothetical protein Cpin_6358 [Sporocytophaga myxococcoides]